MDRATHFTIRSPLICSHTTALWAALLLAAISRLWVIWHYEINWDEFFFLSHIYEYVRGELKPGLQRIYVHFFTWLGAVPLDEIGQIRLARALMLALQLLTGWLLYRISRRYFSTPAACFGLLSYSSFSYVVLHGTSFRADPIATLLLVSCLYFLLVPPMNSLRMAYAGLALGMAMSVTIKSVIFLPTLILLMLIQQATGGWQRLRFGHHLLLVVVSLLTFLLLNLAHRFLVGEFSPAETSAKLAQIYDKTIVNSSLFPRWGYLEQTFFSDGAFWFVLLASTTLALRQALGKDAKERELGLCLMAFCLPISAIALYRNSFPYCYVLILAPTSIICANFWQALHQHIDTRLNEIVRVVILAVYTLNICCFGFYRPMVQGNQYQQSIIDVIHKMFPEPAPYIDRNSMIASFPKIGFFMSSWGRENYHADGEPLIARAIPVSQPKFMIVNTDYLDIRKSFENSPFSLFPDDLDALKNNYIEHWWPIYIAGKEFEVTKRLDPLSFNMLIPGEYSIEAASPVAIDGDWYQPGASLHLEKGTHTLSVTQAGLVRIRWGVNIYRPQSELQFMPVYKGF